MMSTVLPDISEQADAPRAGADLTAARERLGRTLPEMADALRIRLPFLDALERGRLTDLPGNAYALAFLRTYATALGLDPVEMTRRFKAEAAAVGRKTELAFPAPLPDRGLPAGALMLVGLLLAVGVYAGWYRLSGEGRLPAETVLPVPARLAALAPQPAAPAAPHATSGGMRTAQAAPANSAAPVPGSPVNAGGAAEPSAAPPGPSIAAAPTVVAASATAPAADAADPAAAPTPGPASGSAAGPQLAAAVPPGGNGAPPTAAPPPEVSPGSAAAATPTVAQDVAMLGSTPGAPSAAAAPLVVLATADSWVQVRDAAGAVVFSRLLHGGQSWQVPSRSGLLLTTGNAGGTELVLNGVAGAPLGQTGVVLRNVPLNPPQPAAGTPAPAGPAPAGPTQAAPTSSG